MPDLRYLFLVWYSSLHLKESFSSNKPLEHLVKCYLSDFLNFSLLCSDLSLPVGLTTNWKIPLSVCVCVSRCVKTGYDYHRGKVAVQTYSDICSYTDLGFIFCLFHPTGCPHATRTRFREICFPIIENQIFYFYVFIFSIM